MCHTERAGFTHVKSSTTTSFHKSFPTNPRIIIAMIKASKNDMKSTYALRRSLESDVPVNPSKAALHAFPNPILFRINLFHIPEIPSTLFGDAL